MCGVYPTAFAGVTTLAMLALSHNAATTFVAATHPGSTIRLVWLPQTSCQCALSDSSSSAWSVVQLGRLSAGHTERPLTARRQAAAAAAGAAADSLVHGESVLLLPSIATEAERAALVAAGLAAAHRQREATRAPLARRLADKMVRLPTAAAAASVGEADGVHLADEAAETIDAVLLRALARIDAELPLLPPALFGTPSAHPLLAEGALEFSSREPALNVCTPARTATPD